MVFLVLLPACTAFYGNKPADPQTEFDKARIRQNIDAIILARGRYLLEIRPHEQGLFQSQSGNFFANRRYQAYRREVAEVSEQLYNAGMRALEKEEYGLAMEALSVSNRLSPDPAVRELLSEMWKRAQAELEQTRNIEAEMAKEHWPELEAGFNRSIQAGDLARAKRIVAEMEKIDPEKASAYRKQIDRQIEWKVRAQLSRGQLLYGQGFLREALNVWQEALELKPGDPELMENISRARRFLENIDRWGD